MATEPPDFYGLPADLQAAISKVLAGAEQRWTEYAEKRIALGYIAGESVDYLDERANALLALRTWMCFADPAEAPLPLMEQAMDLPRIDTEAVA